MTAVSQYTLPSPNLAAESKRVTYKDRGMELPFDPQSSARLVSVKISTLALP